MHTDNRRGFLLAPFEVMQREIVYRQGLAQRLYRRRHRGPPFLQFSRRLPILQKACTRAVAILNHERDGGPQGGRSSVNDWARRGSAERRWRQGRHTLAAGYTRKPRRIRS